MSATRPPAASTTSSTFNADEGETDAITTTPTRRRRGKLILQTGLVVCCSVGGLAVSIALGSGGEPSEPEPIPTPSHISEPEESAHHEPDPAMDGHQIDILIRGGNFNEALRLCKSVPRTAYGSDDRLLIYREALCLEALGQWREARETYKKATQPNPDLPIALWARGLLGQARCALAESDVTTSRDLLDQVLLRSGDPTCRDQRILAECLFLLGRSEVQNLGPPPPIDPFDITAIAWPRLDGGLDQYLDWLPVEPPPAAHHEAKHAQASEAAHHETKHVPTSEAAHHEVKHAQAAEPAHPEVKHPPEPEAAHHEAKHTPEPKAVHHEVEDTLTAPKSGWLTLLTRRGYVHLKQSEKSIADQLRAIGTAAGLKVKIDPKMEEKLTAISVVIDLEHAPLSAVLTALTRKCGFGWRITGEMISIEPAGHLDESAQRELVLQILRRGLAFAPEHPRARAAHITAVNLDLGAGRRRNAAMEYRQFLENTPHAAESVYVTYNLGLIELSNGNGPVAQARFLDTIDRGPETKWADFGWWWLGRTQLDAGDTTAARKPFQLAREGKTKAIVAAAELGTAACALLEGEEEELREILRSHRVHNRESHAAMAEFFESLLRYKTSPSESRGKRVTDALLSIGEGRLLGPAGFLLAGQTYREIGQHDRATGLYDAAREIVHGPIAVRMTFEAAERYDQLDLRVEARKRYLIVAAVDRETWGLKAELRLADLAIRDHQGEECIRRCRALIGRKGIDSTEVLALMGRGYEFLKLYRFAAECYSGHVPTE